VLRPPVEPKQYLAQRYEQRLRDHRIAASTGAMAESFFGTLKTELVNRRPWPTRKEATDAIADYIAFYNHDRRHSRLGYHSPAMYETETANRSAA
jgi:putative transposase